MEVSGQLQARATLPMEKLPMIHIGQEIWWAQEKLWMLWGREILFSCWELAPGHPAHSALLCGMTYLIPTDNLCFKPDLVHATGCKEPTLSVLKSKSPFLIS
jgi:hypothetical protein